MQNNRIQVRPAVAGDADAIAAIYLAARQNMPYAPLRHRPEGVAQWMADILIPTGGVCLALIGQQTAGFLAQSEDATQIWIDHLYLASGQQGQGIGSYLLESRISRDKPQSLYTFQANTRARAFYERHGFKALSFGDGSGNEEACPDVLYIRVAK